MKTDNRKLSADVIEEKRKLVIRLHKQGRYTQQEIADIAEVTTRTVYNWIRLYQSEGAQVYKPQKPRIKAGTTLRLNEQQQAKIRNLICDKTPDQLKLDYALWTRKAVAELIEDRFGLKMPIRTVGDYLKCWGFTPQKPLRRAYEQDPKNVQRWLNDEYPKIKAAKEEGAEIYWDDETGLHNSCHRERGYAPKGKTPVIDLNVNKVSTNMISAITNQGKVRFRIFQGTMNAGILIEFFERLIKAAKRKVYVILDNLRVHHAKVVRAWLEKHAKRIRVFYLPAYSPELNPDEYLNGDLKVGVHSGKPARNKAELKGKLLSHMRMLQKKPARVQSYFKHPKIAYAV